MAGPPVFGAGVGCVVNIHLVTHTSLLGPLLACLAEAAKDRMVRTFAVDLEAAEGQSAGPWVVLELSAVREEGLPLLQRLRREHPLLSIVVSDGGRGDRAALDAYAYGADFFTRDSLPDQELMAAVRAQVRWQRMSLLQVQRDSRLELELDRMNLEIIGPLGRAKVTVSECKLLEAFAAASGHLLPTQQVRQMFGYTQHAGPVTVMMHRVRRKISQVSHVQRAIRAHRSIGYELGCALRVR